MKNILLISLFIFCFVKMADAQYTGFIDDRLKEVFSEEYLNTIAAGSNNTIKYMNWELDNSWRIVQLSEKKLLVLPYLRYYDSKNSKVGDTVRSIDEFNVNIHKFYTERNFNVPVSYRIGDTGKAIDFFSDKTLIERFNQHNSK